MKKTHENAEIAQFYQLECYDKNGSLKWADEFDNIVVTTGRNHYLDATLKTGSAPPTWFVGLKNAVPAVAADTIGTKGFAELTPYSNATRPKTLGAGTYTFWLKITDIITGLVSIGEPSKLQILTKGS